MRAGLVLSAGSAAVLFALAVSIVYGTTHIGTGTVWQALVDFNPDSTQHQVIREIRLPRALTAALVGAFLALSGAIMQALTRNPLAEPSLLGISYGAALALVIALSMFPGISSSGSVLVSMAGAGLTVLLVFSLAAVSKGGIAPVKLALAGVAIGMFLSSLTSVIAIHFDVSKELSFWYAGSIAGAGWGGVKILLTAGIFGILIVILLARSLTLLNLGAEVTKGLGINVRLVNGLGVLAVLMLTGSSVAIAGTVAFAGLVIPHISRMLIGPDYRYILPVSAVLGSLLLVLGDIGARMINSPYETPIGVITAAVGVPFFLYLVRSGRGRFS
ncbi:ferrichrome ABC transporter permease [Peribacillus deserti]|uniref:Ferrichrome ABC transporter permease n=1 Tax=Peribacillus deserti TaxID=673318 RepID=A0A2N5M2J3_9BACI|nr:ferrichrome ABC transporter permease [Peribacillus deserti]